MSTARPSRQDLRIVRNNGEYCYRWHGTRKIYDNVECTSNCCVDDVCRPMDECGRAALFWGIVLGATAALLVLVCAFVWLYNKRNGIACDEQGCNNCTSHLFARVTGVSWEAWKAKHPCCRCTEWGTGRMPSRHQNNRTNDREVGNGRAGSGQNSSAHI